MLGWLYDFFADSDLSPHGICLIWRPELIWTHAVSDLLIAVSYYTIPLLMYYVMRKRPDLSFSWISWSFIIFIIACGTTHLLMMLTLWYPLYSLEAVAKSVTAAVSMYAAVNMLPIIPKLLAKPNVHDLQVIIEERDRALRELTAEKASREETEAMLRQSQKMEALGHLTGGVAHDFNNLLGVVVMNMERVARRIQEDSPLTKNIGNAMLAADKGARLASHMLAFARQQPVSREMLVIDNVLRRMEGLLKNAVGGAGELQFALSVPHGTVYTDLNQLETSVLNLVVNSRDALPGRGGWIRISTSETFRAGRKVLVLAVADNGHGMSKDVRERALDPFFTTKPVGKGTGLGLSQVYGFAGRSGAEVEIESSVNVGTTVRIKFDGDCAGETRADDTSS